MFFFILALIPVNVTRVCLIAHPTPLCTVFNIFGGPPPSDIVPRSERNMAKSSQVTLLKLVCYIMDPMTTSKKCVAYTIIVTLCIHLSIFIYVTWSPCMCRDSAGQYSLSCKRTGQMIFLYISPLNLDGFFYYTSLLHYKTTPVTSCDLAQADSGLDTMINLSVLVIKGFWTFHVFELRYLRYASL